MPSEENNLSRDQAIVVTLKLLYESPRHGYDIAREVERRSECAIRFKHATLYLILHELEDDGLIASTWEHSDGERPRRIYRLTESGLTEYEHRLKRWNLFTTAMSKVIGTETHGEFS